MPFDVVILAGGSGRRLGGVDKASVVVGGRTLLDGVLAATAGAVTTVVVGPSRPVSRPVVWALESPPGGGPLAGLAAGVAALGSVVGGAPASVGAAAGTSAHEDGRDVVVLAVDLPYVTGGDVEVLLAALDGHDAAAFFDGRPQLLTAAYRIGALRRALAAIGDPHDAPVRLLREHLDVAPVAVDGSADVLQDCDTPEQLASVRAKLDGEG